MPCRSHRAVAAAAVAATVWTALAGMSTEVGARIERAAPESTGVHPFAHRFAHPPMEYRPIYRYWHPGGRMDADTLRAELATIRAAGAGGVELVNFVRDNEIAPIEDYDPAVHGFGTTAWQRRLTDAYEIGERLGLRVDALYTSKWSANLPTVSPDGPGSAKELSLGTAWVDPGGTYTGPVPAATLPTGVETTDLVALRAYPCLDACTGELPTVGPTRSVDLERDVTDGRLEWTAPSGERPWVVVASWLHGTGQLVEGAETEGDSFVVDHFSRAGINAVTDFWAEHVLDWELRARLAASGGSMFFDSLELNRNGEQLRHWTYDFAREFAKRRGYDVEAYIPTLAVRDPAFELPGGLGERVREDYRRTLQELFRDEHLLPLRRWAHRLGLTLRGQPYSSWGPSFVDPIESWSLLDVPEGEDRSFNAGAGQDFIETQGADAFRSMATAAQLNELDIVSSECCASFGRAHRVSRQDLLSHVNQNLSVGVNQIVWHGWSHDAPGTAGTWPGWAAFGNTGVDDSYGPRNPTWRDDQAINDYVARMQVALRNGAPRTDIAIYHQRPGHSSEGTVGEPYFTSLELERRGFTYGFVNGSQLTGPDTPVDDGVLAPDGPRFRALVVNGEQAMDRDVARRVADLARHGLPIVVVGAPPSRALGNHPGDDASVRKTFGELRRIDDVRWVVSEDGVADALDDLGIAPRAAFDDPTTLVGVQRSTPHLDVFAWYNASEVREEATVSIAASGTPYALDPWTGRIEPIEAAAPGGDRTTLSLSVAPGDVRVIAVSDAPLSRAVPRPEPVADPTAARTLRDWRLTVSSWQPGDDPQDTRIVRLSERRLTASPGTDRLPAWSELTGLEAVSGVGVYRAGFRVDGSWPEHPGAYLDLGEVVTTFRVEVNGVRLPPLDQLDTSRIDIGRWLRPGRNDVEVTVSTMLGNAVAGETVGDYGLLGPVRVIPYVSAP